MKSGTIERLSVLAVAAIAYIGRWWDSPRTSSISWASGPLRPRRLTSSSARACRTSRGTLNAGHALPTLTQALIFISIVKVDTTTLYSMIVAAVLGAWFGVGLAARLSRRAIQPGMGGALLCAAVLINALVGALMMLGVGLYAPCLILVSLLGMSPLAALPVMMGSCGLLMPIGGARFVRSGRYNLGAALGHALGGIPGVLVAAYIVKSLPIAWLRWLVVIVVLYAAFQMLRSARVRGPAQ